MENNSLPKNARQAFAILDSLMSLDELKEYAEQDKDVFVISEHFGLGTWIRNNWINGPEDEDEAAKESRKEFITKLSGKKPEEMFFLLDDDLSEAILERYFAHIKRCYYNIPPEIK